MSFGLMVTTRHRRHSHLAEQNMEQDAFAEEAEKPVTDAAPQNFLRRRNSFSPVRRFRCTNEHAPDRTAAVGAFAMLKGHVLGNDNVQDTSVETKQLFLLSIIVPLTRVSDWRGINFCFGCASLFSRMLTLLVPLLLGRTRPRAAQLIWRVTMC